MRDRDLELIAALVEGRLEDEAEARALIGSSPDLQAEYEAQKTAYEALSTVGPVSLTDAERAALRRDVWTELRTPTASAPERSPWYYRWIPALAGMFVIVGLVAVMSQGGDDAATERVAQFSADTTVAADGAVADGGGAESDAPANADAGEDEAMEETATTAGAAAEEPLTLPPDAVDFYTAQASMVRSGALEEEPETPDGPSPEEAAAPCLEAARLAGYVPLKILTAPIETDRVDLESMPVPSETNPVIVAIPEGADLASAVVAFVDQDRCEVIYLDQ